MDNKSQSDGIKRAHNGVIGESRTKSFLIDRFWILERSADIDGADFIIQRRLEGQSILDDRSPRFGVIQSKFSQDERTNHVLKEEYVVDKNGKPHLEFFLIVNVGHEDSAKMCLLSAKDIVDNFVINDSGSYSLPTSKIVKKFIVENGNRSKSLDDIENSIQYAEFYKNRLYVFNELSCVQPDFDAILPEYKKEIAYSDGNIPDLFKEQKLEAYDCILQLEKIHSQLVKFVQEIDPIEACYIAELFKYDNQKVIRMPQIFNKDFYYKARRYLEQINYLKDDGILATYLSLKNIIRTEVNNFLSCNISNVSLTTEHIISINYNSLDLSDIHIQNEFISSNGPNIKDYSYFLFLKEGEIKMAINIGLHLRNNDLRPNINECCLNNLMDKIYELKYFEVDNPIEVK